MFLVEGLAAAMRRYVAPSAWVPVQTLAVTGVEEQCGGRVMG